MSRRIGAAGEGGAITDVEGIRVGHHTDSRRPTGCTVVLCEAGAIGGVDVRGGAPGTRETDLLEPRNLVDRVHAVVLSGGSTFGLDTVGGVLRWLEERGHGLRVGPATIPIVPAAILFDLWIGDHRIRPDAAAGYAACQAASHEPPAQGSVGAGAGACVGKLFGISRAMRGGIGTASVRVGALTVGAIVAVNAVGDVVDPDDGRVIAGLRTADGSGIASSRDALLGGEHSRLVPPGASTTIGCVATNATLTKAQAQKMAQIAHDGLARTIDPAHTLLDGDTMFALATGRLVVPFDPVVLGTMVTSAVQIAVLRGVRHASGLDGPDLPALPSAARFGVA